jgi:integration host factor subunit beta
MAAANRRTMTKAELVEEVARAAELNKRDAEVIVETVFESIIGALHKGEKVELRGFGSFRTRERGPRRGRNPKTGEPVDVPAKRVPYFKPGKELKEYFTEGPEGASASETRSESEAPAPEAAAPQSPDYVRDSAAAGGALTSADVTGEGNATEPGGAAETESSDNEGRTGGSNY